MLSDPNVVFPGKIVFAIPHMDDEILACGGTIAQLDDKARVSVVFVSDGSQSPSPEFNWQGEMPEGLREVRHSEAIAALGTIGIAARQVRFLDLPDGHLDGHRENIRNRFARLLREDRPAFVFVPFRYDRHPDHIAVRAGVIDAVRKVDDRTKIVEYFVYYRWRLIPGGDLRKLIAASRLVTVDISGVRAVKHRALTCYQSQTTIYAAWQRRPILPPERLNEVSDAPEQFVISDVGEIGRSPLGRLRYWIPVAHRLEPFLKRQKDRLLLLLNTRSSKR